jgi:hypothetical protein
VTRRREELDAALAEVRAGTPGDAYARTLYRTVAAVVRRYGFPPPEGHGSWTQPAVIEVANDFASDERTPKRLATLAVESDDGPSFGRQLAETIRNFLRDRARATDRGHAMQRLRDVLSADARFADVAPGGSRRWWALADGPSDAVVADPQRLTDAMFSVGGVQLVQWSGPRRGPIASAEDLAALAEAALRAAGGSVDERTLVDAIATRFGLRFNPTPIDIDDAPLGDLPVEQLSEPDPDLATPEVAANAVLEALDNERDTTVLAHLELPARALAGLIGLGHSAANDVRQRVYQRLRDMIGDREDRDDVMDLVRASARGWYADRTRRTGSPSDSDTGKGGP